ncbi:beta-ketoacyl-ACP synthase 3 [Streptomyces sp. SAJ15]|uniref:beta-ketoacyl-ACP synthase 3 n=1 Tax=Streptomyces sp. SAJ15 TaxID=2011095 RepID=UPI0011863246|nr:beta-ketoacyl-ACP synthase 3 [Streptomyces sp. SAJ15]TVL88172.1 3-oxoacyl-ACP synthase [Streptomyces sp. SAJ15]
MSQLTRPAGPRGSRIRGVGAYRPARTVGNAPIAERIGVSEEWIASRSGILARRFAGPDEPLPVMATAAAEKALAAAGIEADRVDAVMVATISHLTQMPALAVDVAHRLGALRAAAFDVSAACAGFCHALALADTTVRAGDAEHVLVIGADRMTDVVDQDDPATAFLFADGAGAVVVSATEDGTTGIGPAVWGADGSRQEAITMTGHWVPELRREDAALPWPYLAMTGWKVFRWATETLGDVGRAAVSRAGLTVAELAAFIPHQANLLITEALAKDLDLPNSTAIARDIADSGNTSAASIPLAMERLLATGAARSGDPALLIGFGSGLVYAAQVVELP